MTLTRDPHQIAETLYHGQFCPMFIDGQDVPAYSGAVIEVKDPASGRKLAEVPRGGARDVDLTVLVLIVALTPTTGRQMSERQTRCDRSALSAARGELGE